VNDVNDVLVALAYEERLKAGDALIVRAGAQKTMDNLTSATTVSFTTARSD
jgi:hypothetical protein